MIIYRATNKINNKSYIGLTTRSLQERKLEHLRHYLSENTYFHRAIQKYGKDNFDWEVLDNSASTIQELKELETYYILKFNTLSPSGYNMTNGGELNNFENRRDYNYGNNPSAIPIINLTTLEQFDSIKRASEKYCVSIESIRKAIKTKEPCCNCLWNYYDENLNYEKISPKINSNSRKRVRNKNTNEIFQTITAAANAYHIARKTIRDSCNGIKDGDWEFVY